jgi:hypothetical protein
MIRVLQIDSYVLGEIEKVRQYALEHVYTDTDAKQILSGKKNPPGDNPDHVVHIHDGFRVVYSVEKHDDNLYHHISLSYKNGMIGIPKTQTILSYFGILKDINKADKVWLEHSDKEVVNILKKLSN